jgi:hypothetical protein
MGKRELFIALAFVAIGVIAYHLTAPAPVAGRQGFSLSRIWNDARRGIHGNAAEGTASSQETLPAPAGLTELRVQGLLSGRVRLIGESRGDIAYVLSVQSTGPDPSAALEYARRVRLKADDLGGALTLQAEYPKVGRQSATLEVRLPSRLAVLVDGAGGVEVSNLAAARLDGVAGDVTVSSVAGTLAGSHRNGSFTVEDVGSVKLTLQRSRASFDRVAGALTLDVRDGECRVVDVRGPIEIDEVRAEVTITNPRGPVRVGGTDGRVTLVHPAAESAVDVRRAEVEVQLAASVPLRLLTTDDTLRLLLEGPPAITIDAVASQGHIDAAAFGLQAEQVDQESRLAHAFGANGAPRVSLRNTRGEIVIKNSRETIVNRERK